MRRSKPQPRQDKISGLWIGLQILQSRHHFLRRVAEQLDIGLVAEAAVAFLARHLSQDSQRLQPAHQVVGGGVGGGD